jgi:hypothetical protein
VPLDGVAARSRCFDKLRGEPLDPPEQRHMVDLDAPFSQEFFEISI